MHCLYTCRGWQLFMLFDISCNGKELLKQITQRHSTDLSSFVSHCHYLPQWPLHLLKILSELLSASKHPFPLPPRSWGGGGGGGGEEREVGGMQLIKDTPGNT